MHEHLSEIRDVLLVSARTDLLRFHRHGNGRGRARWHTLRSMFTNRSSRNGR